MSEKKKKLIFIYNADSGLLNTVKDFWHKALRPSTYQCNLCQTTFGSFGVKKEWKSFISTLEVDTEFLHKGVLRLLISQEEMDKVTTTTEMEDLVSSKIK